METSTLSLIEVAEDLMVDTRKRIISSNDVYTSFEIVREDLTLAKKNLKEFRKINTTLMVVNEINKNTKEMRKKFTNVMNEYLEYEAVMKCYVVSF